MSSQSGTKSTGFGEYKITGSGTNSEGNHWCNRDYGPGVANPDSYHYSNKDGSWFYKNPDGSRYYNNGQGFAKYNKPNGGGFTENNGSRTYK